MAAPSGGMNGDAALGEVADNSCGEPGRLRGNSFLLRCERQAHASLPPTRRSAAGVADRHLRDVVDVGPSDAL
eukprot:4110262-Prorocentrum_lima.AAC.1